MYSNRIRFAIDNFIEESYFSPEKKQYELKELKESGKSLLILHVEGENICVTEYDGKKRCNFLRRASNLGMQKCIDHFVLRKKNQNWDLHMIEMKSSIGDKKWYEIKAKMRASFLNVRALCTFLGIVIQDVYAYTTYERVCFSTSEDTSDPKTLVMPLGQRASNFKKDEWDKGIIKIQMDEIIEFKHCAIQMKRDDEVGLRGELYI